MTKKMSFCKKIVKNKTFLIMCMPAIAYFIIFCYIPMSGVTIAFKDFNFRSGIWGSPWVGLKNFRFFFISQDASRILTNTYRLLTTTKHSKKHPFLHLILGVFLCQQNDKKTERVNTWVNTSWFFLRVKTS